MEILLFCLSAVSLIFVGLFGILTRKNLFKILLALNIMETGVNLLIVALGYVPGGEVPIFTSTVTGEAFKGFVDPLPQALVLTSIVIGLGTTALALSLIVKHYRANGGLDLESVQKSLKNGKESDA